MDGSREEHADTCQIGALTVVDDGGQSEVGGVDRDTDLFMCLSGRTVDEGFALVEVAAGQVEHAVAVPGSLTLEAPT